MTRRELYEYVLAHHTAHSLADWYGIYDVTGFVQNPESPGILLFRIPGLDSPGKRHRSWKIMEIRGILKQRFWIILFLF